MARDAWMVEALEVSCLIEETESRLNAEKLKQGDNIAEILNLKIINAGVKFDRLESLLLNPSSKPILTEDDMQIRSMMLLDFRRRIFALSRVLHLQTKSNGSGSGARTETTVYCGGDDSVVECDTAALRPLISKSDPSALLTKSVCWVGFCAFGVLSLITILLTIIFII